MKKGTTFLSDCLLSVDEVNDFISVCVPVTNVNALLFQCPSLEKSLDIDKFSSRIYHRETVGCFGLYSMWLLNFLYIFSSETKGKTRQAKEKTEGKLMEYMSSCPHRTNRKLVKRLLYAGVKTWKGNEEKVTIAKTAICRTRHESRDKGYQKENNQ